MRSSVLLAAAALACGVLSMAQEASVPAQPADLILTNAVIYTGEGFAEDKPATVEAMAIRGGKVIGIGSSDDMMRLAGAKTRVRDVDTEKTGVYVFPGFDDAHTHLAQAGSMKLNLDLSGARSRQAMMAAVAEFARTLPPGHWIAGRRWDQTLWPGQALPDRQELDEVTAGHPAFLVRVDGHIALANTAALKAAGIAAGTKAPQGGAIDLDARGQPTGIVRESAQDLVTQVIPPPTAAERKRGLELAIADAVANGVTSVQDFSDWEDFRAAEELEKEGKLGVRISEWIPFKAPLEEEKRERAQHRRDDPMLHTGMLKGFMDGSLGSRTAALKQPYRDDPGNTGLPQFTQAELNAMTVERAKAGFQIGFHAIGDKGVEMALDALSQPGVPRTARNRIEHAQVVDETEIARFRELGVIASMQPSQLLTDMRWAEARLGTQRAAYSYAWKSFLDAGVRLAFGTDYPVEPISPCRGLYAAVTRKSEDGRQSYFPEQRISRGQALFAYTQGSAYAEFAEKTKGRLEPGFDADFILVDRDLYWVPARELLQARTLETYSGGRQVFVAGMHLQ